MSAKILVVTDVHGDVHALSDALARAKALGCTDAVCCGDIVGYGLFADETLDLLARERVQCIRGNHERWTLENRSDYLGAVDLSKASRKFIASLPPSLSVQHDGVRVSVHHGRPGSDTHGVNPESLNADAAAALIVAAGADVLLFGHTHVAFAVCVGTALIGNPGALLRDPAPGADAPPTPGTFGVLELPRMRWNVFDSRTGEEVKMPRVCFDASPT